MTRIRISWRFSYRLLTIIGTIALVVALLPTTAWAKNSDPTILPPDSSHYGATYGEWSARWWQWVYGQPAEGNPLLGEGEVDCAQGQSGQVWFLAGTFGGRAKRSCTIPSHTALFFPVANGAWINLPTDPPFDEAGVRAELDAVMQAFLAGKVFAKLDGKPVKDLDDYRSQSPVFNINLPEGNLFGLPPGEYGPSVADGIYLMLAPLPPGKYKIKFGLQGNDLGFSVDVTYDLTVVPMEQSQSGAGVSPTGEEPSDEHSGTAVDLPSQIFLPFTMNNEPASPSVSPDPCEGPGLTWPFARVDVVICG